MKGKTAWVVGGSQGIGRGCAESLIKEGVTVAITSRNEEKLEETCREIERQFHVRAHAAAADVTVQEQLEAAFASVMKQLQKIDILIYAAGRSHLGQLFDTDSDDWMKNWKVNVLAFVETVKLVVPQMKTLGTGRIIVLGASSGKEPTWNQLVSNVTKGSLLSLVKSLALELAPYNILVNNVCPGRFITPRRWYKAAKYGMPVEEYLKQVAEEVPLKRLGEVHEIADFITFLASEKGSYITGQSINVDGGRVRSII